MNGLVREQVDGGCVRIIEIAKQWQRAGHEIHLMGSAQAGVSCREWGLRPTLHTSRWRGGHSRWWLVLHSITVCLFFPRSLWRLHPDIVVTSHDQPYDVLPGVMLKVQRRRQVRFAVSVPFMPAWRFWRRTGPRWYNALAFLVAQRLSLILAVVFADRTLAVARATARQLGQSGFPMRRVSAVACGVELGGLAAVAPSSNAPRFDAVSVGRLTASKGVFDLVDAWALVVAKKPDAKLVIIGDGPDQERVQHRVQSRGLASNVDLLGAVDSAEKNQCVRDSRLFTLPSHEESWSIAMSEAMALGVPVVAYDLPELLEVWGDAYHAVPESDISALAGAILSLLDDELRRRELVQRGLKRVTTLDWSAIAADELRWLMGDLGDGDSLGIDPRLVASAERRSAADPPHGSPPTVAGD